MGHIYTGGQFFEGEVCIFLRGREVEIGCGNQKVRGVFERHLWSSDNGEYFTAFIRIGGEYEDPVPVHVYDSTIINIL